MLPTLAELLTLPAFGGAQVLSAPGQLVQEVTWVHVSEVLDAARFLSGGELLLSTGLEVARAAPDARVAYLRSLAQGGAHGLALELVGPLREVPAELLQTARLIEFPLITFAHEVRFADLTRAAHERILGRRGADPGDGLGAVVLALHETGRAEAFRAAQLGPLLSLPARPRATLLGTLDALITQRFNVAVVARGLGVRRQTVYYRLEQLRGMLGDLDSPQRQLSLGVALALSHPTPGSGGDQPRPEE
ncbi:PucR family transcriptional regulator [Deinococcus koreensis]|uniref:PucR family transcriptional regulator n=1 Tax=Deinococcus koreensis TaxID=2054903 RepID=A0A2K3UT66_9DEIO|nr:PucR family transcriptional regulator [Deinococcus koreensis]PNY79732.1 PucR family transcriptional regulator [Deinococcus koreensis]